MYIETVLSFQSMCFEDSIVFKTVSHVKEKKSIFAALSQQYCHHVFQKVCRVIKYDIETVNTSLYRTGEGCIQNQLSRLEICDMTSFADYAARAECVTVIAVEVLKQRRNSSLILHEGIACLWSHLIFTAQEEHVKVFSALLLCLTGEYFSFFPFFSF